MGIFNGAKKFSSDALQNYLLFILINKYFSFFSGASKIYSWTSKGRSEENINTPSTPDNSFVPKRIDDYILPEVKFNGNCLRQDSMPFLQKNVVNLYIMYELDTWARDLSIDFTLVNY